MYKIDADKDKKFIDIELSGHMQLDEIEEYAKDLMNIISQFGKKEVLILVKVERLDPFAQCSIPLCIDTLSKAAGYIRKIAFVHKRVITKMQMDRIVKEVNTIHGGTLITRSCTTRDQALKFLYE